MKSFRMYILQSKAIAYIPNSAMKDILVHPDSESKWVKWIARLLEYDIEIKPTKLIKDKGLAKILADSNCKELHLNLIMNDSIMNKKQ